MAAPMENNNTMATTLSLKDLIIKLFDVKGLLFGEFTHRKGEITPVYINMRVIWSYPEIVRSVSEMMWELVKEKNLEYSCVLGLPYQGIPLATYVSTKYDIPMLMKRQQTKSYGTKKLVEGHFTAGDRCLLLDDVIMTGGTLVDDVPTLREVGLNVTDCVCFFDRIQGGSARVKQETGVNMHSVVGLDAALEVLVGEGRITQETAQQTRDYLAQNRFDSPQNGAN